MDLIGQKFFGPFFQKRTPYVYVMEDDKKPEAEILKQPAQPDEVGGPKGPEPTRYGDWEHKGRCIDF